MSEPAPSFDCIIAGAGFAGLACALALAGRGFTVRVIEKKADVGDKLRTTGIIVKDAADRIALLDGLPSALVREIPAVRLYAPNMRNVRLQAPGYYFLATDTPELMRWLAGRAMDRGVDLRLRSPFTGARRRRSGFDLGAAGRCRFLVGADGANSAVARATGLGINLRLLHGIEYEYRLAPQRVGLAEADALHCFVDRRLAPGYIAWMLQGVRLLQVGLARRGPAHAAGCKAAMGRLLRKIAPLAPLEGVQPETVRAGAIPCGGLVRPLACERVLLVGDAAGMVSPLTAGGIHTALQYGQAAGHAIADFLGGRSLKPAESFTRRYPRFRAKRLLRFAYDRTPSDGLFNALLSTRVLRLAAARLYFHRRER